MRGRTRTVYQEQVTESNQHTHNADILTSLSWGLWVEHKARTLPVASPFADPAALAGFAHFGPSDHLPIPTRSPSSDICARCRVHRSHRVQLCHVIHVTGLPFGSFIRPCEAAVPRQIALWGHVQAPLQRHHAHCHLTSFGSAPRLGSGVSWSEALKGGSE
jgi:hypothetical protein